VATDAAIVVVSFGDPVALDYATQARGTGARSVVLIAPKDMCDHVEHPGRVVPLPDLDETELPAVLGCRPTALIVFLGSHISTSDSRAVDALFRVAAESHADFIAIVSTARVDLGDVHAGQVEQDIAARARKVRARVRVFRPGHVLSTHSRAVARLRRFGGAYPLAPTWMKGCCVCIDALHAAIEQERCTANSDARFRVFTLLGPQRPWSDWLAEHRASGFWSACATWACFALALIGVGWMAGMVLALLTRWRPALRWCNVGTLQPRSFENLLALYNPYNARHVKIVGYNNGVNHFGHRYPGKTIVSTIRCNAARMCGDRVLKADCGTTVGQARAVLAAAGCELPVAPNYSYVCLGTAFFVPIHGSAADYSTIADTITRVVLYDPERDRVIAANRGDPAFRNYVYNLRADVLLLRLYVQVKPKALYRVESEVVDNPGSTQMLDALRDRNATNVEIRKANASSAQATVCRYYSANMYAGGAGLTLPRDALGGLWDRLEEHAITSFLMHALARHCIWHVELFFTDEEFRRFWETHQGLPLRKLQVRHIGRDGMPHSPFRDHDCVSVDLFMLRQHRRPFEAYLRRTFPNVRTNPGKHSR
jgi:hypothetical protein